MKYHKLIPLLILMLLTACYDNQDFSDTYNTFQQEQIALDTQPGEWFLEPQKLVHKLNHCQLYQKQLIQFDTTTFSTKAKRLFKEVQTECDHCLAQLAPFQTDPSQFNMGGKIKALLAQDSIPLEQRIPDIQKHLAGMAVYYETAKGIISDPSPLKTQLGAQKHLLALQFLDTELKDSIHLANLSEPEKEQLTSHFMDARIVLKDYLAFCESLYFELMDPIPADHD